MNKEDLQRIMNTAWAFVRRNGYTISQALKQAWANFKLGSRLHTGIVHFYFRKMDGTIREAWGTLASNLVPETKGVERKPNPTTQVYFDTEKQEWRCYKIANLISIA